MCPVVSAPAILESNASPRQKLAAYRPDLAKHLRMSKQPSYRASQIYEHLTVYPERPFKHATSLPASLRTELAEMGETLLSLQNHRDDAEGTTKLLLAARPGRWPAEPPGPNQQTLPHLSNHDLCSRAHGQDAPQTDGGVRSVGQCQ